MCGILFYINALQKPETVMESFQRLQHRGPDNSTHIIVNDSTFMGCHRLAVTELSSRGNQPFQLNATYLICNGQIYNYKALALQYGVDIAKLRSDVDIILHLYEKVEEDFIELLDGDFAFVLYDSRANKIIAGRDPIGVRPLFIGKNADGDIVGFASEVKGIIDLVDAVTVFPPRHYWTSDDTIFWPYSEFKLPYSEFKLPVKTEHEPEPEFIKSLYRKKNNTYYIIFLFIYCYFEYLYNTYMGLPNKIYTIDYLVYGNPPVKINYARLELEKQQKYQNEFMEKSAELRELLKSAVIKRIDESDRPVAFLCSGGLDSSIILSIAHEYLKSQDKADKIHIFSIEYDDDGSGFSYDSVFCKKLATELDIKYTPVKFTKEDIDMHIEDIVRFTETYDPNTIRASIPMYMLAKYIRENTDYKVILSGEGADELFCGYSYFEKTEDPHEIEQESSRLIANLHMFDVLRADRCFNAHGLEIRVPFLDKNVVKFGLELDGKYKLYQNYESAQPQDTVIIDFRPKNNKCEKALLRTAFNCYPELINTGIISRRKEKMSDGCGYSYIPYLFQYYLQKLGNTKNREASILAYKEKCEIQYTQKLFDALYGFEKNAQLIVNRELPTWATEPEFKIQKNEKLNLTSINTNKKYSINDELAMFNSISGELLRKFPTSSDDSLKEMYYHLKGDKKIDKLEFNYNGIGALWNNIEAVGKRVYLLEFTLNNIVHYCLLYKIEEFVFIIQSHLGKYSAQEWLSEKLHNLGKFSAKEWLSEKRHYLPAFNFQNFKEEFIEPLTELCAENKDLAKLNTLYSALFSVELLYEDHTDVVIENHQRLRWMGGSC